MTICIYHGNCADGFGAAWAVRKALGDIEFYAGKYQEPPPDVTGMHQVLRCHLMWPRCLKLVNFNSQDDTYGGCYELEI